MSSNTVTVGRHPSRAIKNSWIRHPLRAIKNICDFVAIASDLNNHINNDTQPFESGKELWHPYIQQVQNNPCA
jgi:hypothetical protein